MHLQLGDEHLNAITLCVWGNSVVQKFEDILVHGNWIFDKKDPFLVLVRKAQVSDFDIKSLNAREEETEIVMQPLFEKAFLLKDWVGKQEDKDLNFVNISQKAKQIMEEKKDQQIQLQKDETLKMIEQTRFKMNPAIYRLTTEVIRHLSVDLRLDNFYQRVILKQKVPLVETKSFKFHTVGFLSGIRIEETPYYKACPTCGRRFPNQHSENNQTKPN